MNIPKKIKIAGRLFAVLYNGEDSDFHEYDGLVNNSHQKFYFRPNIPKGRKEEVFIHEVIHAIDTMYHIKDNGENLNESEIRRLANGLTQVFMDNKIDFK